MVCDICVFSHFRQLRPPTLMLQLLGLLFAYGHLKFKLLPIMSASWTRGKELSLEGASKQIYDIFKVLVNISLFTSMKAITRIDPP